MNKSCFPINEKKVLEVNFTFKGVSGFNFNN